MAVARATLLGALVLTGLARWAQAATGDGGVADAGTEPGDAAARADAAPADAAPSFEPPRALGDTAVPYPPAATAQPAPVVVTVKLLVDKAGLVQKVDVRTPPQPIFDDAVVAAAHSFRFAPARYGGQPVPVEITFTHTFLPPPPPPAVPVEAGPARTAVLRGKLVELGTRAPVTDATVTAGRRRSPLLRRRRSSRAVPAAAAPRSGARLGLRPQPQPVPPAGDPRAVAGGRGHLLRRARSL